MTYTLFAKNDVQLPWTQLARIIALQPGLTMADARMIARRGVGRTVARQCDVTVARQMAEALNAAGCETVVLADDDIVPNPTAIQVRNADCLESGLEIEWPEGRKELIPWHAIVLLTAGVVGRLRKIVDLAEVLFLADTLPDTEGRNLVVDIYNLTPTPHLRIDRREFNYDYLGSQISPSSGRNFLQLVTNLATHAKTARRTAGVEAILKKQWTDIPAYERLALFEQDNVWELQRLRAK